MYQKIMVPMDGSELAECVLPHVNEIAKGCQVKEVVFVGVVEPLKFPSTDVETLLLDDADKQIASERRANIEFQRKNSVVEYLKQLVNRASYGEVNVHSEIIVGQVAESLSDYATKNGVDLIIIPTHGRSGVSRWVRGSVADRILHSACAPVLMVRAPGCVPGI